ncbi:MAG: hypothetical protein E6H08_22605 [Bacteroidetes bacterium]|nr:MAG: hypothetical protein E6H08_22605 [Bacteroidota bacterium]
MKAKIYYQLLFLFLSTGAFTQTVLTRGPYMNMATQSGIIIRWRTDVATDSKVSYGTTAGSLTPQIILYN